MSGDIDGDDAFGVYMLVGIGGNVHELMIREAFRSPRSDLSYPGRVPRHHYVGEQCQTRENRGHLLRRSSMLRTNRPGIDRAAMCGPTRLSSARHHLFYGTPDRRDRHPKSG